MSHPFYLRDGSRAWSDASSMQGRVAGQHYENKVGRSLSLEKPESIKTKAATDKIRHQWKQMDERVRDITRDILGQTICDRILGSKEKTPSSGDKYRNQTSAAQADLEGKVEEFKLTERLGPSAELVRGPDEIKGSVVVEVSIMSALLLVKFSQLERYLHIRCLAKKEDVKHCVIILNRKPIGIFEETIPWQLFPNLSKKKKQLQCSLLATLCAGGATSAIGTRARTIGTRARTFGT